MTYTTLRGVDIDIDSFTDEEAVIFIAARKHFSASPRWDDFKNKWLDTVVRFYDAQGLARRDGLAKLLFWAVQDMGSRLMIDTGWARMPDYRNQLESIIDDKYDTRRQFCEATGLSEDMLSHVLHGRKDLSIGTLTDALSKIGYGLSIVPLPSAGKC